MWQKRRNKRDRHLAGLMLLLGCLLGMHGHRAQAQAGALSLYQGGGSFTGLTAPGVLIVNPAALARIGAFQSGFYCANRFLIKELSSRGVGLAVPAASGMLGLAYQHQGFQYYREQACGISYARSFGRRLQLGLQLTYSHLALGDAYGSTGRPGATIGLLHSPAVGWRFAACLAIARQQSPAFPDKFANKLAWGLSRELSRQLILFAEMEKENLQPASLNLGIECKLNKQFICHAGGGFGPARASFGTAWSTRNYTIGLETSYHTLLGYSPSLWIRYQLPRS